MATIKTEGKKIIAAPSNELCTVGQKKKKKRNTLIYFNTNYRTEMKLIPIIMDYSLLQFDALKFFLGVHLHGGLYLTLIFSM